MQIKSRSSPAAPSAASIPVSQRTYLPYSLFLYTTSCSSAGHVTHQQLPSDLRAIGCDRLELLPHVAASPGHCCPPDFCYEINQPDISWLIHPLSPVSRTFPSRDPDRGAAAPSHCLRRRSERPRSRAPSAPPPPPNRTEVASPPLVAAVPRGRSSALTGSDSPGAPSVPAPRTPPLPLPCSDVPTLWCATSEPQRKQTLAEQPGRRRLPWSHSRVRVEPAMPRQCL